MAIDKVTSKKERIIALLNKVYKGIFDESLKIYIDKIEDMSLDELKEYFSENKIRIFVDDDIPQRKIDDLAKRAKITMEEKMTLPYKSRGLSSLLQTDKNVVIMPIQMRRLQQYISKESNSNIDTSTRNKINQAVRDSKTSSLTDVEVTIASSLGFDALLTELMSPRSDNNVGKEIMNKELMEKQTFSLNSLPKDKRGKNSLKALHAYYISMGIITDLIEDVRDFAK